jgi:hypothetical protein
VLLVHLHVPAVYQTITYIYMYIYIYIYPSSIIPVSRQLHTDDDDDDELVA